MPQTTKDFDFPIEKGRYRSTSPPLKNSETTVTGENWEGGGEVEAQNKERRGTGKERKRDGTEERGEGRGGKGEGWKRARLKEKEWKKRRTAWRFAANRGQ